MRHNNDNFGLRALLVAAAILFAVCGVQAQEGAVGSFSSIDGTQKFHIGSSQASDGIMDHAVAAVSVEEYKKTFTSLASELEPPRRFQPPVDAKGEWLLKRRPVEIAPDVAGQPAEPAAEPYYDDDNDSARFRRPQFHWKPAIQQSLLMLAVQHGFRLTQKKTIDELGGNFFMDWFDSAKALKGWRDGDTAFINYFAHPLQGAVTGRIYVNNSDRAKKLDFGISREYWRSRMKALIWSAAWSTQFELGPISEASIGNVGMTWKKGHCTMAYVDLVVTPVVGTGVMVGEDAIDKYILKNWIERGSDNKVKIRILRTVLTPSLSLSNLLRGKVPWKRDNREIMRHGI
jgi:hypothetical protein